jgi:hypothetical protein
LKPAIGALATERGAAAIGRAATFYAGADFQSKAAERQHVNSALIKHIFLLNATLENVLIDYRLNISDLYFCVRLRYPICH